MGSASGKPIQNNNSMKETNKAIEPNKSKVPPAPSLTPTRKQEKETKNEDYVEAIMPVEDFVYSFLYSCKVEQIDIIKPEPLPEQNFRRITNPIVNVNVYLLLFLK